MKKKVTLIVLLSVLSCLCLAQTLIPKIGFSASIVSGKDNKYVAYQYKPAFVGGLAFTMPVLKNLSFQAEVCN